MNPSKIIRGLYMSVAVLAAAFSLQTLQAQLIYSQNFETDDSANWVVLQGSAFGSQGEVSLANFNFNYSTIGIPKAPHSAPADGTIGLQLNADVNPLTQLGSVTGAGISASPTNFSISDNFDMHVDMWANYNGPNTGPGGANVTKGGTATNAYTTVTGYTSATGGSGSTILYGCGYGTAGTQAQLPGTADSIYVGASGDDGTAAQIRMYGPNQTGSYQDGTYQSTGTSLPGFAGDPFVYNNSTGTRNFRQISNTAAPGWTNHFWATPPPLAQVLAWQQQSNIVCRPGTTGFAWHDVEVQKIGNVIVYSIDGLIAATANSVSAGAPAGSYLTFIAADINGNASVDPNYTNLNFVVFDNIQVFNYNNIVSVQATTPSASEIGPTTGVFTITRTSAGVPLTVNYTLTGSAVNGAQYTIGAGATATSVTLASTATSTNITITPINDGVPNLPATVILTIQAGAGYTGANSDTINIADGNTPTVDITASKPQMYDRYNNGDYSDYILYQLTRRGDVTSALTMGLNYTGTAIDGTDYVSSNNIAIPAGANYASFQVFPIRNPAVTGNRTMTVTVTSGAAIGNATNNTATVVDSDNPTAPVVLSDPLTSSGDASNWSIHYGSGDPAGHATDYSVDFGYDLASATIPAPPSGAATALHMTCNKNSGYPGPGAPGGVNAYYTKQVLSGNFAVRFSMNLVEGSSPALNTGAGEGALFGINHTGSLSNWWYSGGTNSGTTYSSDGQWYYVSCQYNGTLNGDYQGFTGIGGTNNNPGYNRFSSQVAPNFVSAYKSNPGPFTSVDDILQQSSGIPASAPPALGYDASTWADVEIKQVNNLVTLSINHTAIMTYTNTTVWTSGYLMLGYADPLGASVEYPDAGVYYASLQVVQLTPPAIANTVVSGGNVTLTFSSPDSTATFVLQSSAVVSGPYADVSPAATIVPLGNGQYQVTTALNGDLQFYRLRYK